MRIHPASGVLYVCVPFGRVLASGTAMGWFSKRNRARKGADTNAPPQWQVSAQFAARARWASHAIDFFGDPTRDLVPNREMELPHRPDFLVLEFAPRPERPYWTYLTAGLSFVPQAAGGSMPHLELIAYSPAQEGRIADVLLMASHDVATADPLAQPFQAYDLWAAEVYGMTDFVLVPAREPEAFLDFPNLEKRHEDARYVLALTGATDRRVALNVLTLVPLSQEQWRRAHRVGSATMLQEIGWSELPKTFGWAAMNPPIA